MSKVILIPLSGGLDSTYAVYKALEAGHTVITTYLKIDNNKDKVANELKTINLLDAHFTNKYYGQYKPQYGRVNSIDINSGSDNLVLPQMPAFLMNLMYCITEDIDEIHLGGVLNDDMISYEKEIKDAFEGLKPLLYKTKDVKIKMPHKKLHKFQIIDELPEDLLKLVTTCEHPKYNGIACGNCGPCKRIFASDLTKHPQYKEIEFNIYYDLHRKLGAVSLEAVEKEALLGKAQEPTSEIDIEVKLEK